MALDLELPAFALPPLPNLLVGYSIVFLLYLGALYIYRLLLHPLARYPGPKLAAISNWYEFYYDVIQHGDFTRHIQELHKQYGMPLL
jgi:hypothetical protein